MSKRVIVIAEAGVNHNGSLQNAFKLVDVAAEAGADYVKFQTFIPSALVTAKALKTAYQNRAIGEASSQLEMLKDLALSFEDFKDLQRYCNEKNIGFLSSPFDLESLDFLLDLEMDYVKIPSGEITNYPFLRKIADSRKPAILSTGMCTYNDISAALEVFGPEYPISLLQCHTDYPTRFEDINLKAMRSLRDRFLVPVGLSDHTLGYAIPIAAAALGAVIIEKHFTLDKTMEGPDHQASLEPTELKEMVKGIRQVEVALGDGLKEPSSSELEIMRHARKSIVAKVVIEKGSILTDDNLSVKRPGTGLSPMLWPKIIGMTASRDYDEDELIDEVIGDINDK